MECRQEAPLEINVSLFTILSNPNLNLFTGLDSGVATASLHVSTASLTRHLRTFYR